MKVLISTSSFGKNDAAPLRRLKEAGCEVIMNPYGRKLTSEEAVSLYSSEIVGVIAGTESISDRVLSNAGSLKVISRCGIGIDNIDLSAAKKNGIQIFTTVEPVAVAVAELTLGLMLTCLRNIVQCDRAIRRGEWTKSMGSLLQKKKIGIIGMGNIGKKVVELSSAFRPYYVAFDSRREGAFAKRYGVTYVDLEVLLREADIVTVHLPLLPSTRGLIDRDKFTLMKETAIFINTSRGEIIDEDALFTALNNKKIRAAAVDTFSQEPYQGQLTNLHNIVLTSHIGSYARESRVEMERLAVENLLQGLGRV